MADEELLFLWANDSEVRNQAINQHEITIDDHRKWISQRLIDPNTRMWILEVNAIPAGQIRWNLNSKEAILDYSISDAFRGKGLGKEIIKLSIDKVSNIWIDVNLIAEVKENNIASEKAITVADFEKINSVRSGYFMYKLKI